jgi:hypothetical protein
MYMVWFQIAVEWPQQGSSWLCAADGFGSQGYEAHWAGCDSGSKTVLVRIGFFFLNAVIKTASKTYFFSL